MALTVKQLIEFLKGFKDSAIITDCYNNDFVHLSSTNDGNCILSIKPKIGNCNRTGSPVFESEVKGYTAYCPELDEDLHKIEFTK